MNSNDIDTFEDEMRFRCCEVNVGKEYIESLPQSKAKYWRTNMPEMEIMKEFKNRNFRMSDECSLYIARDEVGNWLPGAVKREVRKALGKVWDLANTGGEGATIIISEKTFHEIADEYKLKPRYCEGMQELIRNKIIDVTGDGGEGDYGLYTGVRSEIDGNRVYETIRHCPKCPEGKNCIGGGA